MGWRTTARISRPRFTTSPSWRRAGRRMVNSSPPWRATVSPWRRAPRNRSRDLQHVVARPVAERVVDYLEAVEVQEEHREARSGGARPIQGVDQLLQEEDPVGQVGPAGRGRRGARSGARPRRCACVPRRAARSHPEADRRLERNVEDRRKGQIVPNGRPRKKVPPWMTR